MSLTVSLACGLVRDSRLNRTNDPPSGLVGKGNNGKGESKHQAVPALMMAVVEGVRTVSTRWMEDDGRIETIVDFWSSTASKQPCPLGRGGRRKQ